MAFGRVGLGGNEGDQDGDIAEINIVPLVDVLLVLLVIFMITAPVSIGGIKVQLPVAATAGATIDEDRIVLSVSKDGEYYIGEKVKVSPDGLAAKFQALYEHRKSKELYIRADREVQYDRVVYAMSAAKVAGITKLGMLTSNQSGPKAK